MKIDEDLKKTIEKDWEYLKMVLKQGGNPNVALTDLEDDFEEIGLNLE